MIETNYTRLSDEELAAEWERVGLDVPKSLVTETLARGERMVRFLGPMIAEPNAWDAEGSKGWAPLHALMLLQALRAPSAAPYAADFLRLGLGDDWLTEEGHALVFSLGPECVNEIWAVVEDEKADLWGRLEALDGLSMLGMAHESVRSDLCGRLRELAASFLEKPKLRFEDSEILMKVCVCLARMHHEESRSMIERAYDRGYCDEWVWEREWVLDLYNISFEDLLAEDRHDPLEHFSRKSLQEMKELYMEEESPPYRGDEPDEDPFLQTSAPAEEEPLTLTSARTAGRNDPCPCGSGKKYKKCCLK